MYRLLIADDEESIREGVTDFIRENCPVWEVAALARDGREALSLARSVLPDAILTDITMPHMNGLDFLENLRDVLPESKLLVLSGYDQFEYAVQALRLGVSDYLLKPLDTSKLISALDRFAAELDAQELRWSQIEALHAKTKKTNEWEVQNYFRCALLGEDLPELSAENTSLLSNSFCCVLCDGMEPHRDLLAQLLEQRLYGAVRTVMLRLGSPSRQVIVFCVPEALKGGFFLTLTHALTSIVVSCKRTHDLNIRFFIGCIAETPDRLALSYRQSCQAQAYAFPEQATPVTTYEDVLASQLLPCPKPPEDLMRELPAAVQCESKSAFCESCGALFDWFVREEIRDSTFIRMCVLRLCFSILQKSAPNEPMSYYEFTNFQQEIMAAGSLDELRTCLENFVSLRWLRRQEEKPAPRRVLTERVSEVVLAHLSDINFSLDDVASALFISPNYLRQLFKQETGQTFTEYLTSQRMKSAKMLLGNPETKVYDVAEQVGYADSRYFSVCFKKYYHMTPSEYQASLSDGRSI